MPYKKKTGEKICIDYSKQSIISEAGIIIRVRWSALGIILQFASNYAVLPLMLWRYTGQLSPFSRYWCALASGSGHFSSHCCALPDTGEQQQNGSMCPTHFSPCLHPPHPNQCSRWAYFFLNHLSIIKKFKKQRFSKEMEKIWFNNISQVIQYTKISQYVNNIGSYEILRFLQ